MKQLSIDLRTIAPLAIRSDHAADGASGAKYIPGTTFIGSLAAAYRLLYPTQAHEFESLFLSEQVLYSNLYPASFKDCIMKGIQESNLPVYPLPKTAQSCKRHPGFRLPKDDEEKAHGVRDSLIDWALFKIGSSGGSRDPLAALREHKKCTYPHPDSGNLCNEAMDHFESYYRRQDTEPYDMISAKIHTRLRTHTGIDRDTGTVQDGILYNREVFEEEMRFWGNVQFPDDDNELITSFSKFIDEAGHTGLVRVGTGRTRGMGKVAISAYQAEEQHNAFADFKQRLLALNQLLHKQAKRFEISVAQDHFFFALTLHSQMILCDDLLRYQSTIDAATLLQLLNCELPELQRIYYAASMHRVTGWQEMWGLPRVNEYAIDTGSVFLFSFACPSPPDTEVLPDEEVLQALFALEEQGMGKRCAEGFGRVRVSDQFHQEIKLR